LIAAETAIPIRTVERAVADLLRTPYLSRNRRPQSSNTYNINFDALLKDWDDYKARGAAYRVAVQETVTKAVTVTEPSPMTKSHPSEVADQPVKCGGSIPSRVADKQKKITGKEEKKSRMASPLRGDGDNASLVPPAGEVKNVGGLLARFERAFKENPNNIANLDAWEDWLYDVYASGDRGDPNVERAARLGQDIYDHVAAAGEFDNSECPF
jgi:hypothetical protein